MKRMARVGGLRSGRTTRTIVLTALTISIVNYLWDRDKGHARRAVVRDQAIATARRLYRQAKRLVRYKEGRLRGTVEELFHLHEPDNPDPDDRTVRDRVETELLGNPHFPKGDVNVDVVQRVVELRGQVATRELIAELTDLASKVPGVVGVHSYLHLPGTPAPNKAEVLAIV
jgi:osmotically-inducible protein OsmY